MRSGLNWFSTCSMLLRGGSAGRRKRWIGPETTTATAPSLEDGTGRSPPLVPAVQQDPASAEGIVRVTQDLDDSAKRPTPLSKLRHLGGLRRTLPLHLVHLSFQRNGCRSGTRPSRPSSYSRTVGHPEMRLHRASSSLPGPVKPNPARQGRAKPSQDGRTELMLRIEPDRPHRPPTRPDLDRTSVHSTHPPLTSRVTTARTPASHATAGGSRNVPVPSGCRFLGPVESVFLGHSAVGRPVPVEPVLQGRTERYGGRTAVLHHVTCNQTSSSLGGPPPLVKGHRCCWMHSR